METGGASSAWVQVFSFQPNSVVLELHGAVLNIKSSARLPVNDDCNTSEPADTCAQPLIISADDPSDDVLIVNEAPRSCASVFAHRRKLIESDIGRDSDIVASEAVAIIESVDDPAADSHIFSN